MKTETILVSACLAGQCCRYDGKSNLNIQIEEMVKSGTAVAVCPEALGGLPCPRVPCEIVQDRVKACDGKDLTQTFLLGAERALDIAKQMNCKVAVLKAKSPSCGSGLIYDGSFTGKLISGDGITAALLKKNGIRIFTEKDFPCNLQKNYEK